MSGFANQVIGGLSKLVRPAIQSPNYKPATAGWTVNADGSAEFNDGTFRGTVIIDSTTAALLVYSGVPANGNLIVSLSSIFGEDTFGNFYPRGLAIYDTNIDAGILSLFSGDATAGPANATGVLRGFFGSLDIGLTATQGRLQLQSQTDRIDLISGAGSKLWIQPDGTSQYPVQFGSGLPGCAYYEEVLMPAQSITNGIVTQIINLIAGSIASDYGSAWNLDTGVWTCPETAPYDWTVASLWSGSMSGSRGFHRVCSVFNTGPFEVPCDITFTAGNTLFSSGTFMATKGTPYHVEVFQGTTAAKSLQAGGLSYVHIGRRLA